MDLFTRYFLLYHEFNFGYDLLESDRNADAYDYNEEVQVVPYEGVGEIEALKQVEFNLNENFELSIYYQPYYGSWNVVRNYQEHMLKYGTTEII